MDPDFTLWKTDPDFNFWKMDPHFTLWKMDPHLTLRKMDPDFTSWKINPGVIFCPISITTNVRFWINTILFGFKLDFWIE